MLGIDQLVPEIMLGLGVAVFTGSLLALVRSSGGRPKPYLMKNPSARPRPTDNSTSASEDAPQPARHATLNRARTAFFMLAGFVTALWSVLTLVGRP
jgi:hypothetical protein